MFAIVILLLSLQLLAAYIRSRNIYGLKLMAYYSKVAKCVWCP
jgi:hypothetical protein